MSGYQRPWWLMVNKPAGLITTVQEESRPGQRIFVIHGEPVVQGLAWLTWGPVTAVLVVILLTGVALVINVREQTAFIRGLMVMAFLGLPALVWIGVTLMLNRLSRKHLQAEREADTRECVIRLCRDAGELCFKPTNKTEEQRLPYDIIRQVKVTRSIGERVGKNVRLTLDTDDGPLTVLDEALGTHIQKVDLANEIQKTVQAHTYN